MEITKIHNPAIIQREVKRIEQGSYRISFELSFEENQLLSRIANRLGKAKNEIAKSVILNHIHRQIL